MKVVLVIILFVVSCVLGEIRISKEHTSTLPVPKEWIVKGRAQATQFTRITIAIAQTNLDALENRFWEVSNPKSSSYGKFMDLDEVNALVAPTTAAQDAVTQWLRAHGIEGHAFTRSGDFVIAHAPVKKIEELLQTSFHVYSHEETGQELVRALSPYSVPLSVAPHIDFIGGLKQFPKRARSLESNAGSDLVSPSVIKKVFNMDPSISGKAANNSQAVAQFLQQYYSPSDLATFQKKNDLPAQTVSEVVGPNQPNNPGVEASLDIEYIMAMAPNISTWFVYTDGTQIGQEPFLDWVVNMSGNPNSPFVHSVSYGDDESSVSLDYVERVNVEFMKYGLVGRSILFASGDDGTGCDSACNRFAPNWPASSPYVTAVGGVYLDGENLIADTIASGGFSNIFSQPAYQSSVVPAYLANHSSPARSFFNASSRGIPDIASFSENVLIEYQGQETEVGGTSCAAPVISGVIALLNDARLLRGKGPLGFLNTFLYQTLRDNPDAFTDITTGNNRQGCCGKGFDAAVGWDPITGVGIPNFPNLLKYALAV